MTGARLADSSHKFLGNEAVLLLTLCSGHAHLYLHFPVFDFKSVCFDKIEKNKLKMFPPRSFFKVSSCEKSIFMTKKVDVSLNGKRDIVATSIFFIYFSQFFKSNCFVNGYLDVEIQIPMHSSTCSQH